VAYTSPKSITEMVIRTALKREGLTGKVEILPLGGLGPALTALAQGAVAAAPFNDPALTITPDKYKVLFYGHQYYPKFTWQVAVTTREFAGKNPQALRKILDVHRKAVEFVYGNREETARIYAKVWEVSLAEASAILPKYYEWQHWSRGDFSKEGLAAVTDGLISVGELKEPFDWSRLIDQSLLDEDLRRPL
jgi:ABC-type nitrate/sulfonate/bicarbonate transport system substrate-binding protein